MSGLDVAVATAAMDSRPWAEASRQHLLDDGRWLARLLPVEAAAGPGARLVADAPVHYRCLLTRRATTWPPRSPATGSASAPRRGRRRPPRSASILAPLADERPMVAKMISAVVGSGGMLAVR